MFLVYKSTCIFKRVTQSHRFWVFLVATVFRGQSRSRVHCCHPCCVPIGLPVSANHEAASGGLKVKILLTGKQDRLCEMVVTNNISTQAQASTPKVKL